MTTKAVTKKKGKTIINWNQVELTKEEQQFEKDFEA